MEARQYLGSLLMASPEHLGWEVSAEGKPGPGMRPVPLEVAAAAEEWLEDYRRDPKRFR